jgi:hypothetical protein
MSEKNPNETYCDKILAKTMDYCIFQEAPSLCQTLLHHYLKSCQTIHKPTVNSNSISTRLPDESFEIYKRTH